jgi:hypothetical protein
LTYEVLPGDLEYSEQSGTAKHRDAKRGHHLGVVKDRFNNAAYHNKTVKSVEQGHKITLQHKKQHVLIIIQ